MATVTRTIQNVLLVLAGLCAGLLLGEITVRLLLPEQGRVIRLHRYVESERGKFTRYDEALGWAGLEDAEADFEWADTRHHVVQNRYGFRGTAYDQARSARRRIVVLGDSFVWGFGVEDRDLFTARMEREARSPLEVVNLGVSGYGTDQKLLLWQAMGRRWSPSEVLLVVSFENDLVDNWYPVRYGYAKPLFKLAANGRLILTNTPVPRRSGAWAEPAQQVRARGSEWFDALTSRSVFANLVVNLSLRSTAVRRFLESRQLIPPRSEGAIEDQHLYRTVVGGETARAWELLFAIIARLQDDVSRSGARLSVAVVPSMLQVYPELWDSFIRRFPPPPGVQLDRDMPQKRIAAFCGSRGIISIDLLAGLREAGRSNPHLYYPVNRHWTANGHAVVARAVLQALGER